MTRRDWNLLVLAAAQGEPLSPAQLQKCLFLLDRNLGQVILCEDFYSFHPYHYGPFCSRVYSDAEDLSREGLASIHLTHMGWSKYSATPEGIAHAHIISQDVDPGVMTYITAVVNWARRLSFPDLVRSIYEAYPDQRVNSVFQG